MQVVQAKCPNCGAALKVDPSADQATCGYCGVTSFVQRRSAILHRRLPLPPDARGIPARQIARQQVSTATKVVMILPFVGALAGIVVPIAVSVHQAKRQTELGDQLSKHQTDLRSRLTWGTSGPALLADVDGDGTDDAIGIARYVLDGDRLHLAAFSGKDGHQLWQSPKLGTHSDLISTQVALANTALLWADKRGGLHAYARTTGAPLWSTSLGEIIKYTCHGPTPAEIDVMTADERWHRVRLADGTVSPTPAPPPQKQPRERHRQRKPSCDALPSDDERTITGATVTDRFGDLPTIEGMDVDKLAELLDGQRIAIGSRRPGTSVPMLAALDAKGTVLWKSDVPGSDPLTARTSAPELFALDATDVVVIYERQSQAPPTLASFDIRTGARRWEVPLAKGTTIVTRGLSLAKDSVFVSSWGHLQVFDRASGRKRFMVGAL